MILSRRKLIGGIGLLVAAPAIVRASSLMPVKVYQPEFELVISMQAGGINYLRGGIFMPDGTIKVGPEYKGRYSEWQTTVDSPFSKPRPYKRIWLTSTTSS